MVCGISYEAVPMDVHVHEHNSLWLDDNQAQPSWPEAQAHRVLSDFTVASPLLGAGSTLSSLHSPTDPSFTLLSPGKTTAPHKEKPRPLFEQTSPILWASHLGLS